MSLVGLSKMIAGDPESETSVTLDQNSLIQCRLAHLNMLQGVIGRMAGYSSSVKNFAVTISAASLAFAFDRTTDTPLWIALGATLLFFCLDAYYFEKEKGFRGSYERVSIEPLAKACDLAIKPDPTNFLRAFLSVSVSLFYLPLLAVLVWLIVNGVVK